MIDAMEVLRRIKQNVDIHGDVSWCHAGKCSRGKSCSLYKPNEDEKIFLYNLWKEGKSEAVMKLYTTFHEDVIALYVAIFKDETQK